MTVSALELFILSILNDGPAAAYDLQRRFGISVGSSLPALERLRKDGLLSKTATKTATARPRYEFEVTQAGKRVLKTGWQPYIQGKAAPADVEAALRVVAVAVRFGATAQELGLFLHRLSGDKTLEADLAEFNEEQRTAAQGKLSYISMRAHFETNRLRAEAQTLEELANSVSGPKRMRRKIQRLERVQANLEIPSETKT